MTIPTDLPRRWRCLGQVQEPSGICIFSDTHAFLRNDGLQAIFALEAHADGNWMHLSVSRPKKLPTWVELVSAKIDFLGPEVAAVQILPPESQWVNAHAYTLHLWHYLDGPRWPIVEGPKGKNDDAAP